MASTPSSSVEDSGVFTRQTASSAATATHEDLDKMAGDAPEQPKTAIDAAPGAEAEVVGGAERLGEPNLDDDAAAWPEHGANGRETPLGADAWTDDNDDELDAYSRTDGHSQAGSNAEHDEASHLADDAMADGSDAGSKKDKDEGPTGKVFDDIDDYSLAYDVSRDLRNLGDRHSDVRIRRSDAYRRLVQSTSYAIMLEERVKELEESLEDVQDQLGNPKKTVRRAAPHPPPPPRPARYIPDERSKYYPRNNDYRYPERRPERDRDRDYYYDRGVDREREVVIIEDATDEPVPEMILKPVRMTLDEFESHIDIPEDKLNHFLEFLVEKPSAGRPSNAMHLSRSRRRRRKINKSSGRVIDKDTPSRVERIRINSDVLCEVLEDVLGKDVAPVVNSVILRPFKPFLGYLAELHSYAEKLKKEISDAEENAVGPSAEKKEDESSKEQFSDGELKREEVKEQLNENEDGGSTTLTVKEQPISANTMQAEASAELSSTSKDPEHSGSSAEHADEHTEQVVKDILDDSKVDQEDSAAVAEEKTEQTKEDKKKTPPSKKLAHLQALLDCFEYDLKEIFETHKEFRTRVRGVCTFDDLWHLFQPGDIIWSPKGTQAYQVLSVHDGRQILNPTYDDSGSDRRGGRAEDDLLADVDEVVKNPFIIDAFHIDFDGEVFGPVQYHWTIKAWAGEKVITKLDTYPLAYAMPKPIAVGKMVTPELMLSFEDAQKDVLLARGKKFKMYANAEKVEAVDYKGQTVADLPEQIDSQVIIDTSYYYDNNKKDIPDIGLLDPTEGDRREVMERCACGRDTCEMKSCYDDRKVEQDRMDTFITESAGSLRTNVESAQDFKDEYLILLPGQMWGFVLHNRAWHQLDVSKIEPARKTQAFEDLVLKPEHRRLVESQVTMHSTGVKPAAGSIGQAEQPDDKREDLVRGKGKGLIILLHGAPGVGKTSTAECVAEYTKRPLLSITCGDIGDEAMDVQKNLEYNLNLAHRWGCVMLLDEADVFLAARDKRDMKRNAVVSVFLRVLEYYSGILFLTTNKIGVIDEAFQSRIHLSLYYPPLDEEQTARIWEINLRRQKKNKPHLEFEEKDLLRWAQYHWDRCKRLKTSPWNGRQIRNACQTVAALAEFDNSGKITVDHLKAVAKASAEFDNYLKSVHGGDNAFRAKRVQDRRDDYYDVNRSARDEDDDDEYFRSGYAYVDDNEDFDDGYRDNPGNPPPSARLTRRGTAGSNRRSMRASDHYSPMYDDEYDMPRASRAELSDRDRDRRPPPPPEYDDPIPRERPNVTMGPPPRPNAQRERDRWAAPEDRGFNRRPSKARSSRDRGSDLDRRR